MCDNFNLVAHFLEHSPNLEVLILRNGEMCLPEKCIHINNEEACWEPRELLSVCPKLKIVDIQIQCREEKQRISRLLKCLLTDKKMSERMIMIDHEPRIALQWQYNLAEFNASIRRERAKVIKDVQDLNSDKDPKTTSTETAV